MDAVTKNWVSREIIIEMVHKILKKPVEIVNIKKMSGGFCSAVYLIETSGEKMVLKIASDKGVKVMRHERKYIQTEIDMLKRFNDELDIPMPKLISYDDSGEICKVPYFFMSYIEGNPLCEDKVITENQRREVKEKVGIITKQICTIKADCFGIPNISESFCKKNSEFTYLLFDWLLMDAEEKGIKIPSISPENLRSVIQKYEKELDYVTTPVYVHTDTWDGNLMIKNGKLTGMVDFAAILYGDPLISHDFHDFGEKPNSDFLQGYGKIKFTDDEKIRIQIYRIWQRLGMIVERGYREYEDPHMYEWVLVDFAQEVNKLLREDF